MFENNLFVKRISLKDDIETEAFNHYPLNINALRRFVAINITSPVTIFNGENGCGKSTLIEALADILGIPVNGGNKNLSVFMDNSPAYAPEKAELSNYLTVTHHYLKPQRTFFFRAESFHEFSYILDHIDGIPKYNYQSFPLLLQSHGESFMDLIERQFVPDSLYLLDEPESALSPQNQLKLLCIIDELVKEGTQFIIATHSPIILGYRDAKIVNLDDGMRYIDYEHTNIYRLYHKFINEPGKYQEELFDNNF